MGKPNYKEKHCRKGKIFLLRAGMVLLSLTLFLKGFAQPVAKFTSNITQGCAPVFVQFTNTSVGNNLTYRWDLGNGNTSTVASPGVLYTTAGDYRVTLTVTDGSGQTDSTNAQLRVYESPVCLFSASDTAFCAPDTVSFNDLSYGNSNNIVSWTWDFGDGGSSLQENPRYLYKREGVFPVILIVTDDQGCSSSCSSDKIYFTNSTADFAISPFRCGVPATVDFINTSSAMDSVPVFYWDFGDSGTDTARNPSHVYTQAGSYVVKLVIMNGGFATECADSITKVVSIGNFTSGFDFTMDCPVPDSGFTIDFKSFSNPAASLWNWNFGDGLTSQDTNPAHLYASPGTYTITLVSVSANGCSDTTMHSYASPGAVLPSDTLSCHGQASFPNASTGTFPLRYAWNFGDSTTSVYSNSSAADSTPLLHSYASTENRLVTLTVTDSFGCSSAQNTVVFNRLNTAVQVAQLTGCIPRTVDFTAQSANAYSGFNHPSDSVIQYQWNFADPASGAADTARQDSVSHHYNAAGTYPGWLIVKSAQGCYDSVPFLVSGALPPDSMGISFLSPLIHADTVCFNNVYQLSGFAEYQNPADSATDFNWNFQAFPSAGRFPGTTAQGNIISFNTKTVAPGADTLMFIVGSKGCNDTLYQPLTIVSPVSRIKSYVSLTDTAPALWYSCSPPYRLVVSNHSSGYESVLLFGYVNLSDSDTTLLDTASVLLMPVVLPAAGQYAFILETEDSSAGCTNLENSWVATVDSISGGFTVNQSSQCLNGNSFAFHDTSFAYPGKLNEWFWDFGDNTTLDNVKAGKLKNDSVTGTDSDNGTTAGTYGSPTHAYQDTGTYVVSLTVSDVFSYASDNQILPNLVNPQLTNCSVTIRHTIRVEGVFAAFTPPAACFADPVSFVNQSGGTSVITGYQWDFGDGSAASLKADPVHSFPACGNYTVSLFVTDTNNCRAEMSVNFPVLCPVAAFRSAPAAICPGDSVFFMDLPGSDPVSCLWNFGDGISDTLADPRHLYSHSGTFGVSLRVTDAYGCSDSINKPAYIVVNPLPVVDFTANVVVVKCPPSRILFTDSASSPDIAQWLWNFGDGETALTPASAHIYTVSGNYDVSLEVFDSNGCSSSLLKHKYIQVGGPTGNFNFSPDTACVPQGVHFVAAAQNALEYLWDFGDGNTFASQNDTVSHLYTAARIYTPYLLLEDSNGCKYAPAALPLIIDGVTAGFSADSITCTLDSALTFVNHTVFVLPVAYSWFFGDDSTSSDTNPSHPYASPGTDTVTLRAVSLIGCSSSATQVVHLNKSPVLQLPFTDTVVCAPAALTLNILNKDTSVILNSFAWNFDDGSAADVNPVTHFFAVRNSDYKVKAVIEYADDECTGTVPFDIKTISKPRAGFAVSPLYPSLNTPVQLTDQSADANGWQWFFVPADSSLRTGSTVQNPEYMPSESGAYLFMEVVTDVGLCPDTATQNIYIGKEAFIQVPRAFSPNGDGVNDVLYAHYAGIAGQVDFNIYNGIGNLVFHTDDITQGWDGTYHGKKQDVGTFTYYIQGKAMNSDENVFVKGSVNLLR